MSKKGQTKKVPIFCGRDKKSTKFAKWKVYIRKSGTEFDYFVKNSQINFQFDRKIQNSSLSYAYNRVTTLVTQNFIKMKECVL